jgi:pyruvate-formate lyase-activating enzyme
LPCNQPKIKVMTLAQKAYELQQKINLCIDTYGECTHEDADELESLCDLMTSEDESEFLSLYQTNQPI